MGIFGGYCGVGVNVVIGGLFEVGVGGVNL